jgi:hypothetical protein
VRFERSVGGGGGTLVESDIEKRRVLEGVRSDLEDAERTGVLGLLEDEGGVRIVEGLRLV